ncbi:hypothetical protein [Thauera sp. Sel9]|uniref:hypothetical protein n=1 Tax=Thauera sp. Sel9 TaxID=2974299 RepID=UPI0021E18C40|nr:hypothetical protein [Thauera sp. Sel9]MCV2216460.1 hypothetical protein [Thauera sp. Sel9]
MYEIWLTLNILFELGLQYLPEVIATVLLWAMLMLFAATRPGVGWRQGLVPAIAVGVIVTAISFFITPGMTKSSFANMGYWVDWMNLFFYAAAFGAVAAALAWPIAASMYRTA